ncbi:hypothetical protein IAU60_006795 [Kwoniella sp. DSM 27419]
MITAADLDATDHIARHTRPDRSTGDPVSSRGARTRDRLPVEAIAAPADIATMSPANPALTPEIAVSAFESGVSGFIRRWTRIGSNLSKVMPQQPSDLISRYKRSDGLFALPTQVDCEVILLSARRAPVKAAHKANPPRIEVLSSSPPSRPIGNVSLVKQEHSPLRDLKPGLTEKDLIRDRLDGLDAKVLEIDDLDRQITSLQQQRKDMMDQLRQDIVQVREACEQQR